MPDLKSKSGQTVLMTKKIVKKLESQDMGLNH